MRSKILLVDDRRENLLALENLLASDDVEILCAGSGADALALVLEHAFALALIDVQMPGMNGFELAKLMRSAERSRRIPIIFVTASQNAEREIFEGYEKGAVDYLLKPLNAHIVRSKVRVFVELHQKNQALDEKSRMLSEKLKEVERLKSAAEGANRAKSRFLANVSHEIRTPLGAMLGYAELLSVGLRDEAEREQAVHAILRNGQALLRLVDDVLDLAKIEAEKMETEVLKTDLRELIQEVAEVHERQAREKGLTLAFSAEGRLPRQVETDPFRLKQILNNIIGNAVKFTASGKVQVQASFEAGRRGDLLNFRISDTGIGIAREEMSRLFTPFLQADSSTKRLFGGTGLGLAISKQLARLLGGDISLLDSQAGKGSVFLVSVAAGPEARELLEAGEKIVGQPADHGSAGLSLSATQLAGVKVLVVDDTHDIRVLITRVLQLAGAAVDTAENGDEAVHKALAQPFDAVLMDIQMPGMDGYEATGILRARGFKSTIVALTAHAMKDEMDRCLRVGCDHYLSKPVDWRALLQVLGPS